MSQNPLQQYFRQPKIYITLPSKGVFYGPDAISGSFENIPVYGMTGMDEIILKTPDALMSGESTVKIVESCCPTIKNAWEMSAIDANLLYAAIRIATYGNAMSVTQVCKNCETENDFDIDLNYVVEHYGTCNYNHKLTVGNIIIKTKPLNYKDMTEFNLTSYTLQQKLNQANDLEDAVEKQKLFKELFEELSKAQQEIFLKSVDAVEVDGQVVDNKDHISEWLHNCDKVIFDSLKKHVDDNRVAWDMPSWPTKCDNCGTESTVYIELDQSSFFEKA